MCVCYNNGSTVFVRVRTGLVFLVPHRLRINKKRVNNSSGSAGDTNRTQRRDGCSIGLFCNGGKKKIRNIKEDICLRFTSDAASMQIS